MVYRLVRVSIRPAIDRVDIAGARRRADSETVTPVRVFTVHGACFCTGGAVRSDQIPHVTISVCPNPIVATCIIKEVKEIIILLQTTVTLFL